MKKILIFIPLLTSLLLFPPLLSSSLLPDGASYRYIHRPSGCRTSGTRSEDADTFFAWFRGHQTSTQPLLPVTTPVVPAVVPSSSSYAYPAWSAGPSSSSVQSGNPVDSRRAAPSSASQQAAGESGGNQSSPSAQEEYGKEGSFSLFL